MEKIYPVEFIKNYLSVVGIPQDKLDENTSKVLCTVILSVIESQSLDSDQQAKLENIIRLAREDKKQEIHDVLKTLFDGVNQEVWRGVFIGKLAEYLLDMTNNLGDSLTEDQKRKLAGLINNLAT